MLVGYQRLIRLFLYHPSACAKQRLSYSSEKKKKLKKSEMLVVQSCLALCDPMSSSLPGSSVYGILQIRILD